MVHHSGRDFAEWCCVGALWSFGARNGYGGTVIKDEEAALLAAFFHF